MQSVSACPPVGKADEGRAAAVLILWRERWRNRKMRSTGYVSPDRCPGMSP